MIVYTVETIGGQITSYEANKENLPKFLEKPVKVRFLYVENSRIRMYYISYLTGCTACYTMDN